MVEGVSGFWLFGFRVFRVAGVCLGCSGLELRLGSVFLTQQADGGALHLFESRSRVSGSGFRV